MMRMGIRPVFLTFDELEALRLVDLEGMFQEDAARMLGISRKTLGMDLRNGRRKVVMALVSGAPIRVLGGSHVIHDDRMSVTRYRTDDEEEEFDR